MRWLGHGYVVEGGWGQNFALLPPDLHLVLFYHLQCLKNAWPFSKKWGQSWWISAFPYGLSLQLDALRKMRVLGKTYISVSFVFAQNSVVLVYTLLVLGFGT